MTDQNDAHHVYIQIGQKKSETFVTPKELETMIEGAHPLQVTEALRALAASHFGRRSM